MAERVVRARLGDVRRILLALVIAACSAKAPAKESSLPSTGDQTAQVVDQPPQIVATGNQTAKNLDPREKALCDTVANLLENEHLLHRRLDDTISKQAFDMYLDRLDHTKMFLLKSDRFALAKHADKIDDEIHAGDLALAHDGEKIYIARVEIVDKMVQDLLSKPFDFSKDEYIETDVKKYDAAADDDELRERWRQRLELEVLERVAGMEAQLDPSKELKKPAPKDGKVADKPKPKEDVPATPEGRQEKARADLAKSYAAHFTRLKTPNPTGADSEVVNAVAQVFDPHTDYFPPADKANFDIQMTGSLEGIGAVLREKDHLIEVSELVPGGASWRQGGIAPGDLILSVQSEGKEPVDVTDMRIDEVVKMIRGPKGTNVTLRIQKPTGAQDTVTITRDTVVIEEAYARAAVMQMKNGPKIGYIHLPSFYGGRDSPHQAGKDVHNLLVELGKQKVSGVILDIRSNGGGLLGDAVEMTGEFIDHGPVVQVQDSHSRKEVLSDDDRGEDYDGPLIVMVDHFSASASEILAGALQDYHRAVIVGTSATHGKGTVQTIADLDRMSGFSQGGLGALKITIQQFFRVDGPSTQLDGVTPDILLPDPNGYIESGERTLEHALPASKISAAQHDTWKKQFDLPKLVGASKLRVDKQPVLSKIAAASDVLKARVKDTRIPLKKDLWEKRRKDEKAALDAVSPDLDKVQAAYTVTVVTDPSAPPPPPGPGQKTDDRLERWSKALAHDPWVDESIHILADMAK